MTSISVLRPSISASLSKTTFLTNQKERIERRVDEDIEEAQRREQQIKDLPHPYAKEIETCISLEQYCHQLMRKAGLEIDSE